MYRPLRFVLSKNTLLSTMAKIMNELILLPPLVLCRSTCLLVYPLGVLPASSKGIPVSWSALIALYGRVPGRALYGSVCFRRGRRRRVTEEPKRRRTSRKLAA